ncbi:D-amino-acid oxidase [Penicillium coprophilum]|uniref:D-amino-acid oxidase n=1 Tax=Penicillium coprophilum TaxID=36646 RepID=UPI0023A4D268|nr:D-amino-acid oxidase [Penicillium coprophilum]KAJ5159119.1 D-amino-acid oxidase [Penicillium coprophilum]
MSQGHVIIVGAGVIGLSIAVKLSKYMRITVIARELPGDSGIDYASPWAGAHFRPIPAKTEEERKEQAWMRHTYQEFEKIARDHPEAGVEFIPAVEYFDTADATSLLAEEKGYTTWPEFRILDPAEYPSQHPSIRLGVTYRSWVLNSPVYLKWLQTRAEAQGTRFIRAPLTDLEQAASVYLENKSKNESDHISAVVDASGRGFNDPKSFPLRGQFIIVSNHCDKTISHHWSDGSFTVIIPRPLGGGTVIGGTKEPNNLSEDIDDAATEDILKRVRALCPEMVDEQADEFASTNGFDIKQVYVARRPMRRGGLHFVLGSSVAHGDDRIPLISCYGAGQNGYKISWALADDIDRFFSSPK